MTVAGWPADLPPAGTGAFDERVVGWLLDRGPSDLRTSDLRRYPLALAQYVEAHVAAGLEAARRTYGRLRVDLPDLQAADLGTIQRALEAQGAHLLQAQREVNLVAAALRARAGAGEPT
mgnify:CR=1 FL=1